MHCATILAALSLPISAAPDLVLTRSGGVMGTNLVLDVDGGVAAAGDIVIVLPSFLSGPTPLSLIDPGNPDVLEVGIDLLAFALVGPLDASGQAQFSLPIPVAPVHSGLVLRAQALSLDTGTPSLSLGGISNLVQKTLALPGEVVSTAGEMMHPRTGMSAVVLGDGRVLLAGGDMNGTQPGQPFTPTSTYEIYDPQTEMFTPGASAMLHPRTQHESARLANGRVMMVGGLDALGVPTATVELYDPQTDSFLPVPPMSVPRVHHTTTLLEDGRLLVLGGLSSAGYDPHHPIGWPGSFAGGPDTGVSELYDPVSNTWSLGPRVYERSFALHSTSLLSDGRVLVAGGAVVAPSGVQPQVLSSVKVLNFNQRQVLPGQQPPPFTPSVTSIAPLPQPRALLSTIEIEGGGVLLVGGGNLSIAGPQIHLQPVVGTTLVFSEANSQWIPKPDPPGGAQEIPRQVCEPGLPCPRYVTIQCPSEQLVPATPAQEQIWKTNDCNYDFGDPSTGQGPRPLHVPVFTPATPGDVLIFGSLDFSAQPVPPPPSKTGGILNL